MQRTKASQLGKLLATFSGLAMYFKNAKGSIAASTVAKR